MRLTSYKYNPPRQPNKHKESKPSWKPKRRLQKSFSKPVNVRVPSSPHTPVILIAEIVLYTDRVQRLKDARSEAEKEIEEYKRMKEEEFQAFEASVCHSRYLFGS